MLTHLRDEYLAAQLAGDRAAALRVVVGEGVEQGASPRALLVHVIQAAQYEIGRRWQENEISVAQEHLATAVSQFVVAHLYRFLPRASPNGRRVVMACATGEQHELGARIAADFLEMAGFDVRFLGANVPVESLVGVLDEIDAEAVALSATTTLTLPALRDATQAIRERQPALPIVVGGRVFAFTEGRGAPDGARLGGSDAEALVRTMAEVLGA